MPEIQTCFDFRGCVWYAAGLCLYPDAPKCAKCIEDKCCVFEEERFKEK